MTVASPATTLSAFPTAPTRTGYTFAGWWTGSGGTGTQASLSTPITANVTFYPKWVSYSYTVTFNGMEATTAPSPVAKTVTSPATTVGTLPAAPARTGYIVITSYSIHYTKLYEMTASGAWVPATAGRFRQLLAQ